MTSFHPVIQSWFTRRFGKPTDVQREAWQAIGRADHTLIAAPTGSGKTLAALLPCIDRIVRERAAASGLIHGVRLLYITPLRALNRDIHEHVAADIRELDKEACAQKAEWPGISVAVRTGDTPQSTRASILKNPPDILVTTPESLYLMLTVERARSILHTVNTVIVDEIHSLAADLRGMHLSLSLERLVRLTGHDFQRIGVSATQRPLERMARYLTGAANKESGCGSLCENRGRSVSIVDSDGDKRIELVVTMPEYVEAPAANRDKVWHSLLESLTALVGEQSSVLVFVNSRRLCERLTLRLNDFFGYEAARSHHGSISRERRLETERLMKAGKLRFIVATSSLELGIDVGVIEQVIQIDSPLEASSGIQRIGRAGHSVGGISRGAIIARHPSMLPEIAVLARRIIDRDIDEIRIPKGRLDVLAQHIVSIVVTESIAADDLYRLVVRADPYRELKRSRFDALLDVLSGKYPFARQLIAYDPQSGLLSSVRGSKAASLTGAGTIPSTGNFPVIHEESRIVIGELDEEFVAESRVGDVFQLGAQSWMIRKMDRDRLYVAKVNNIYSEIPFWRNETGGRTAKTGEQIGRFLARAEQMIGQAEGRVSDRAAAGSELAQWLADYSFDSAAVEQLALLLARQHKASRIPTHRRIVVEVYRDLADSTHLVIHTVWGYRFHRTWMMAMERIWKERLPQRVVDRMYSSCNNSAILYVFREWDPAWLDVLDVLDPDNLEQELRQAIPRSPMFASAFRHMAETSLLMSSGYKRTPLWQLRYRSEQLLRDALPFADRFPLLEEAFEHCLRDRLDVPALYHVLRGTKNKTVDIAVMRTENPSPFAEQIAAEYATMQIYELDVLSEDLQLQLATVSTETVESWFGDDWAQTSIDPEVVRSEQKRLEHGEAKLIDPDDLYRWLKRTGDRSQSEVRARGVDMDDLRTLLTENKVAVIAKGLLQPNQGGTDADDLYVCADELDLYKEMKSDRAVQDMILQRFADHRISLTPQELKDRYGLSDETVAEWIEDALEQKRLAPAPFAESGQELISSRVSQRIVRESLHLLRNRSGSIEAEQWIVRQGAASGLIQPSSDRIASDEERKQRVLMSINKLQGRFYPLSVWETELLPSRVPGYRPQDVDDLCASGEIMWVGRPNGMDSKSISVSFFLTNSEESAHLMQPFMPSGEPERHVDTYQLLLQNGPSFLTRLSMGSGLAPSERLQQLLELARNGWVSNDLISPLRLAGNKGRFARTGSGQGRWYALASLTDYGSAVSTNPAMTGAIDPDEPDLGDALHRSVIAWARHLFEYNDIVTKELANYAPFSWSSLSSVFRYLEDQGRIVRGLFIRDASSLQWMTRRTVESLGSHRSLTMSESLESELMWVMSAIDPLQPFGLWVPWPNKPHARLSRKSGNYLLFRGQRWSGWIEQYGNRIAIWDGQCDIPSIKQILSKLQRRHQLRKIVIRKWNENMASSCDVASELIHAGAETDGNALVFWPSSLEDDLVT